VLDHLKGVVMDKEPKDFSDEYDGEQSHHNHLNEGRIGNLNGKWAFGFKLSMILGPILVSIAIAAQGWMMTQLNRLDDRMTAVSGNVANVSERLAVIEGNRFTTADALKIWEAIAKTNEKLATVPTEIPPKWVIDRLDRTEVNLDKLADTVRDLSKHVNKITP
jgi:hypothetical protein